MESLKNQAISALQHLPDDATMDQIMETIYVQQKMITGITQLDQGESISHEEMKVRLKKWLQ